VLILGFHERMEMIGQKENNIIQKGKAGRPQHAPSSQKAN